MEWVDVTGPPGIGKSALCDDLWEPRALRGDGTPPPEEWREFLSTTASLMAKIRSHPSIGTCKSMVARSFAKMATVNASPKRCVYIQTGFAQRGLGIGWRMEFLGLDPSPVARYYQQMPVSRGVALLVADVDTVQKRNRDRGKDRAFMVPFMQKTMEIAATTLKMRGVPLIELDMKRPIAENRAALLEFSCQ